MDESLLPLAPQPEAKKSRQTILILAGAVGFLLFCCGTMGVILLVLFSGRTANAQEQGPGQVRREAAGQTIAEPSARAALRRKLGDLNREHGGTLRVLGGYGDAEDRQVEALVYLQENGQPRCGIVRAVRGEDNQCRVQVQMGHPAELADLLGQGGGDAGGAAPDPAPVQPLSPRPLPDGSGSIMLPAGWTIHEANMGAVVASGANGDLIELGGYTQMYTQATFGGAPPTLVQWGPAAQIFPAATQSFWNFLSMAGGPQRRFRQLVESQPLEGQPGSQTLLAVYDWDMNGKTYRSLGLMVATPTSPTTWLYYLSSVSAPQAQFTRDLPTLQAIWQSRQVDPGVTRQRLAKAAATLRSCTDIIADVNANRQRAFDRANDNWLEYIRGTAFVRDAASGETREVPAEQLDKMVEQGNRTEGYKRFNVIPRRDLEP